MLARVRDRLTYANVVSTLCLFIVLGGTAWAAVTLPAKSVGTKQLKNKAVTRVKIADRAVNGRKLARNSVNGLKVTDGKITGADVNESTLDQVPEAQHANRATDSDLLSDHTFGYFEAASRTEFGSGSRTATSANKILEWTNAHAQVVTDGDSDANPEVRVKNTNAAGAGDLLVIESDGNFVVVTEGSTSVQLSKGNAGDLHFVVARPDGRTMWVRCAFPAFPAAPVRCLGERSVPN
ncbi:MAG TPA: hypothetical protein VJT75_06855 [Thermoleophilaceae bacterium]|nr:hypothetical protein [Thermoleophilaceae bacterium]